MNTILKDLSNKYNNLDVDNRQIIIWGMGNTTQLHMNAFNLEKINIYAFTDSKATDGEFNGKPIISLSDVKKLNNPLVVVCIQNCKALKEISDLLKDLDVRYMGIDEFFFVKNTDVILSNYNKLADDKSKFIYKELIKKRVNYDFDMHELYEDKRYLCLYPFNAGDPNEFYVDCGAYIGDNIEPFLYQKLGYVKEYYAFEPDEGNYKALVARIERINTEWNFTNKIHAIQAGVGEKSQTAYFDRNEDISSKFTDFATENKVEIVSLDDYFKGKPVSTIKADIESYELPMLKGAASIIKNNKPKLAISIYHSASDMYTIMNYIDKLNLGYKFYIRHHWFDFGDTILYAVCE